MKKRHSVQNENRVSIDVEWLETRRHMSVAFASIKCDPIAVRLTIDHAVSPASATPGGFSPAQIRAAYGFDQIAFGSATGDGTGQTIAIIDAYDDPTALVDLKAFDAQFGLPDPPSFKKLNQYGN